MSCSGWLKTLNSVLGGMLTGYCIAYEKSWCFQKLENTKDEQGSIA